MPVSSQTTYNVYTGNGTTTSFAYSFRIISSTQLKVYVAGVLKTSGYTVSGVNNSSGGNVTFSVAPAAFAEVRLVRDSTTSREYDYTEGGSLAAETLDADQDYQTMLIQELKDQAVIVDPSTGLFDAKGNRIINVGFPEENTDAASVLYVDQLVASVEATQGPTGAQGIQGTIGSQGVQGTTGIQGPADGPQGIQGIQGIQGNPGVQGSTGSGAQGTTGAAGSQGIQGTTGIQGPSNGPQGTTGAQGIQGSQGIQGRQGTTGAQGTTGSTGPSTTINATDDTATTVLYPVMVGAAGSNQTAKATTSKLTFDASTGTLAANSEEVGFRRIPQNSQSGNYTCVIGDAGKHIYHPSGAGSGDVFTIPANSSVAYPVGTTITFINMDATNTVSIAITTDTMYLAGVGTTGSRTLASYGVATATKITSTSWLIAGTGLT